VRLHRRYAEEGIVMPSPLPASFVSPAPGAK
jgi:hypothetical protein